MKWFLLLSLFLIVAGCSSSEMSLPEKGSPEATLFAKKCGICHPPPHPGKFTIERWRDMLGLMEMQMERKGVESLRPEEKNMILDYLGRSARKGEGH